MSTRLSFTKVSLTLGAIAVVASFVAVGIAVGFSKGGDAAGAVAMDSPIGWLGPLLGMFVGGLSGFVLGLAGVGAVLLFSMVFTRLRGRRRQLRSANPN